MDEQLDRFITIMIGKVNALVAGNYRRNRPWERLDFFQYIRGACEWFFFDNNITREQADINAVLADIYYMSDIIAEIEDKRG